MSIQARFKVDMGVFRLDVDLQIPLSGATSVYGPSGSGKTTLLRAIAGLDRHPGGTLRVGEATWQGPGFFMPPHQRPIGYVFQEASLFQHLDVMGNLQFGLKRTPAGRRRIALDDAIDLLEIRTLLNRDTDTLSGGERQRVAIARALAVSPEMLLLDEPLAAVDFNRKQEIIPYLESLHRQLDIPIIHVSHLPEEVARLADHLILLESGRVVASGGVQEVFARLDLPLSRGGDAAALIEAEVLAHDESYHLTHLQFAGGRITLARNGLPVGSRARLRLAARDVSLTLSRQSGTSILNIIPATVDAMTADGEAQVTVRLEAAGVPILACITRKSADELALEPGKQVFAQIKSIALLT